MKHILVFIFFAFAAMNVQAQTSKKYEVARIQTSAECQSCKDRLEEMLNYTKGVKYAELDLSNMQCEVKYQPAKISLDEIRQRIAATGYDADHVKTTAKAMEALPKCCRPGGMQR